MKTKNLLFKAAITTMWLSMPFAVIAQNNALTLKRGLYVQTGTPCKDAPFAAMRSWDGLGFADPHSSKCTSKIMAHHGNHYQVQTACLALGDGAANPSGHPDVETVQVIRLSASSFAVGAAKQESTFRWCSAR